MKYLLLLSIVLTTSCSDATKGSLLGLGKSRHVKCYSGGTVVYEGDTTGKIKNEQNSDGYYFTDSSGMFVEIKADCVITVKIN